MTTRILGTFTILATMLLLPSCEVPADEPAPIHPSLAKRDEEGPTLWFDLKLLSVEGQGFADTKAPYDRLPARAEGRVRDDVWNLSRDSSGIAARFITDAPTIQARWTLTSPDLAMPHMAATGVSGLDLYVRDDQGLWRWLACGRPTKTTNQVSLVANLPKGAREYLIYLPLYNGVSSIELGIPEGSKLLPGPPRSPEHAKPIVFYGTSITHGACASRPGMVHTAILGRRFDRPVINLGFSGNGRLEPAVVEFLSEIDAAVYVIDCLPNVGADDVLARGEQCMAILRRDHPTIPIVLVEDRSYSDAFLIESKRKRNQTSRAALRQVFERLRSAGDANLYYLPGDHLLGDDNEGTVDSSHPTDLGFMRQADAFAEVLAPLLPAGR